jgi:hypothetical protein
MKPLDSPPGGPAPVDNLSWEAIPRLRAAGIMSLLIGGVCLPMAIHDVRQAEQQVNVIVGVGRKMGPMGAGLLALGILLTFFPRRAFASLGGRWILRPFGWLALAVTIGATIGVGLWIDSKLAQYGYVLRPIRDIHRW